VIDVDEVLRGVPPFEKFLSVAELAALAQRLGGESPEFEVRVAGMSAEGRPIHHIRVGHGRVKALIVGFIHPNEPIGALTVVSLLTLLKDRQTSLGQADIEWHVVPCIDPDGAALNEGWSQQGFSVDRYLRNCHRQAARDQVEASFPIQYKRLSFDQPTQETRVLQSLMERIRPDFYCPLHNTSWSGAFYLLSRDLGQDCYAQLYALLERYRIPMQPRLPGIGGLAEFGPGVSELVGIRQLYALLEKTEPHPEEVLQFGAISSDYAAQVNDQVLTLIVELPYVRHPDIGSPAATGQNARRLRLRIDAEIKYFATVILEEWDKTQPDLDPNSPFYRKIFHGLIGSRERLPEDVLGFEYSYTLRDLLFNPEYSRIATAGDRFNVYSLWLIVLCQGYEFVRLLAASKQTPAVVSALGRLESVVREAVAEIERNISFDEFEPIDLRALASAQLGSALIVLNSLLGSSLQ